MKVRIARIALKNPLCDYCFYYAKYRIDVSWNHGKMKDTTYVCGIHLRVLKSMCEKLLKELKKQGV